MSQAERPILFRFESFELNPRSGELRKNGSPIKLQDQPAKLLALLVSRAGQLVTRAEIQEALWSESTFVEFDHAINTAMRKIRDALGDDLEKPRFIETLPRKGYRFLAPVEAVDPAGAEQRPPSDPASPDESSVEPPADPSLPAIGETISRYRIEEKLGQGGMGIVFRARDTRLGRTVALKMLLPELAANADLRRRLKAEARAASSLSHPVIATVYDLEEIGERAFIVYEYVPGTNLRELIRQRALQLSELLSVGIQIADGLAAAHQAGFVHRDLKPENVMITAEGRVKILDFGLAKLPLPIAKATRSASGGSVLPSLGTPAGVLIGTVHYMSPEQLEGEAVDHRTDLFSFGVVLYEMATGRHPFQGKSLISTIGNILKEEPFRLASGASLLPPELDVVIRKCLRKRREERYQSARDLLVDLEHIRREQRGPATPSGTTALPEAPAATEFALPRNLARALFLITQMGYLAMYCSALYFAEALEEALQRILMVQSGLTIPLVIVLATCGIAVRLYLLTSVGLNHPEAGAKFEKLFPCLLVLDAIWSASPLSLSRKLGYGLAFGAVAALAYLPFSQRVLVRSIYQKPPSPTS